MAVAFCLWHNAVATMFPLRYILLTVASEKTMASIVETVLREDAPLRREGCSRPNKTKIDYLYGNEYE
jgi:hypothetical protein